VIINNTITQNQALRGAGIDIWDGCDVEIKNTILWGNTATDGDQVCIYGHTDIAAFSYSDIEGGIDAITGQGEVSEWVECITKDPLFLDPDAGDFHLEAASPCIDAGDPEMTDPDGTICDIGAFCYLMVGLPQKADIQQPMALQCWPNPSSNDMHIDYFIADNADASMRIVDKQGRLIRNMDHVNHYSGKQSLRVDITDLRAGIYYIVLQSNGQVLSKKIVKL
jgi:hypothetical protein